MKKLISLLLVLVFICSALVGCDWGCILDNNTQSTTTAYMPPPPNDELKLEIIKDYLVWSGIQSDKTPNEIDCEFYGVYNESIAVYFHTAGAYQTPLEEKIAGYKFIYPDSRVIRIWNNGKFYRMLEAYEKGLITETNIFDISRAFQSIEFQDPYFIYEDKIYNEPNFKLDTLAYNALSVVIDKSLSRYNDNKEFDVRFFGDIELIEWCELWRSDETHQEFLLIFPEASSEKLLQIIDNLYQIDGIKEVCPLYSGNLDLSPNDELFKDEAVYIQWALDKIFVEKVWDFTTGSSDVRVGIIDRGIASHEDLDDNYLLEDA